MTKRLKVGDTVRRDSLVGVVTETFPRELDGRDIVRVKWDRADDSRVFVSENEQAHYVFTLELVT